MDFTPGQLQLLAYWGTIQQAVSERASTADLWSAVRNVAAAEGVSFIGVTATDMSALRGIAAGQRNARETLAAARPDQAIEPTMIASDLSARGQAEQNLAPSWLVRFEHDITVNGQLQTVWRTSTIDGFLPATKSDLLASVTQDAVGMADDYGVTHIGVGQMQISAV